MNKLQEIADLHEVEKVKNLKPSSRSDNKAVGKNKIILFRLIITAGFVVLWPFFLPGVLKDNQKTADIALFNNLKRSTKGKKFKCPTCKKKAAAGMRTKGSKNKVGLEEASADKNKKGYNWNNMMLQRWVDHNGIEHKVLDDYQRNVTLVDLTAQPDHIKEKIWDTIKVVSTPKNLPMVGAQFLKFCGKYDLVKLSENASSMADWLTAGYPQKDLA